MLERGYDVMPIVSATMPRESEALSTVNLKALAAKVEVPVLLLLGSARPAWAPGWTAKAWSTAGSTCSSRGSGTTWTSGIWPAAGR